MASGGVNDTVAKAYLLELNQGSWSGGHRRHLKPIVSRLADTLEQALFAGFGHRPELVKQLERVSIGLGSLKAEDSPVSHLTVALTGVCGRPGQNSLCPESAASAWMASVEGGGKQKGQMNLRRLECFHGVMYNAVQY